MAKLFNDEIIDSLRRTSKRSKFDQNELEPGETFIAQQPLRKEDLNAKETNPTAEGHPECKTNEARKEAIPPGENETGLEGDDDCEVLKGAGDARAGHVFDDFLSGIAPTHHPPCANCSSCSKLGTPIRRILGPFPDEPIMAAVDKVLTILGITLGAKEEDLAAIDEESDTDDDTEDFDSGTAEDMDATDY